jgi:hypothetical protein
MTAPAEDLTELLDTLEALLGGDARARIVDGLTRRGSFDDHLRRLRSAMTAHAFGAGDGVVDFARAVRRLDSRTRQDGFRVLHAWDHTSHRFTGDVVPALLLDFYGRARGKGAGGRVSLEILLDYYFLHLLCLCAMRVWDTDEPDVALDRLTGLVGSLQGEGGSGHRFVADAETLLIYALSQFHPEEQAYDRVIERVATLTEAHQLAFAEVSAAVLSSHLRWGFWLMYGRDVVRMRADNGGDYPWLLNTVLTLLRGYAASVQAGEDAAERAGLVGALLQGLAADAWAFTAKPPPALQPFEGPYAEARALLAEHGPLLLEDLEAHRPTKDAYAPLSLHFNFPHNTLVAIVTLALLEGRPQRLPINALFERAPSPRSDDEPSDEAEGSLQAETREGLARTLMAFSRSSPDRLGYRGAMLVAYDPLSGMRSFSLATDALRKSLG